MAETDSFIEEVSEEVRRDRLFGFFKKWGWLIALVLVLIVGAAAFSEWRKAQIAARNQAQGDALLAAITATTPQEQAAALATFIPDNPDQAALAELARSAALVTDRRNDDAASALETVVANGEAADVYTDLAALKSVLLDPDAADRLSRLEPLVAPGRPFRLLALEARAQVYVEAGDTDAALADLTTILEDTGTTRELRVRSQFLTVVLGGEIPRSVQLLSEAEELDQ